MNLTVIVPFWNGQRGINRLITSLPPTLPILIVDDHSDVPLQLHDLETRGRDINILRPRDKGYFTGAVNAGIEATDTDVLILNQDTWLDGAAALDLLYDKRPTYAVIGERIKGDHPAWKQGYIHGTFMFIRRDAIRACGLMDAHHFPLWGSTADYQCRLARKGFDALALETVPGFNHERRTTKYGEAITEILKREPDFKSTFIRTPPVISVVITCYNYARFLPDAINSLIGGSTFIGEVPPQTFQGFEVIIVDDGSTDDTPTVGKALASDAKGIHYIRRTNGGTAAATNTGVAAAKGKYIAILAADDMMAPGRLEKMLAAATANPRHFIYDDMTVLLPDGGRKSWKMATFNFDHLLDKNHVHAGILFPKAAWTDVGGYPEVMRDGREDWAFNIALGSRGWCGLHLDYEGYMYRRTGQNRTLRNTSSEWHKYFKGQLMSLYPKLYYGERDPMCCGHDANYSNGGGGSGAAASGQSLIAGSAGMVLLRYQGGNAGESSWWAGNPPVRYVFGGSRPLGYVASNHVDFFLKQYEGNRPMFVVEPQATPEPVKEEEKTEVVETVEETEELPAEEVDFAVDSGPEIVYPVTHEPSEAVVVEAAAPVLEVKAKPKRNRSGRK